MAGKNFFKDNLVLITGLTLPVLLMFFFMLAGTMQDFNSDPPQYDMVFSVNDGSNNNTPLSVNFVVKDGVLKAQYTRIAGNGPYYYGWKKLYIYDSKKKTVRELSFGLPSDIDSIHAMREETVTATKDMKLDTSQKAPDGYEYSYEGYSHSGMFLDLWGGSYSSQPRLRKGNHSTPLGSDGNNNFYYGSTQFIGWVNGKN